MECTELGLSIWDSLYPRLTAVHFAESAHCGGTGVLDDIYVCGYPKGVLYNVYLSRSQVCRAP